MKKTIYFLLLFCNLSLLSFSQESEEETQFDSTVLETQPLFKINKDGSLIKDVHMIANMRFALNNQFANGNFINSQFRANDLRMEIIGRVSRRLKVRFRDVYSRSAGDAETVDLLRRSIDLAYVEFEATPALTLTAGKMFGDFGGYEIFHNPITMVVYNDWIANGDIFLSAFKAGYKISDDHKISLQVANSSSRSFNYFYGNTSGIQASKAPFGITLNWNGNFANDKLATKWSYSSFNLAKGKNMNTIVLGTQYKTRKISLQYDFKYSDEQLDRTGVVSNYLGNAFSNRLKDVAYLEHWLRADFFINKTWNARITGMNSYSYWQGNPDNSVGRTSHLKTVYTIVPSIECLLSKEHNIKAFLSYVGKFENYSAYGKKQFGLQDRNSGLLLIGFMSHFVVF